MSKNPIFKTYAKELNFLKAIVHTAVEKHEAICAVPTCHVTQNEHAASVTVTFSFLSFVSNNLQEKIRKDTETCHNLLRILKDYGLDNQENGTALTKECAYSGGMVNYTISLGNLSKLSPLAETYMDSFKLPSKRISEIIKERTLRTPPKSAIAFVENARNFHKNAPSVSPLNVPVKASIERHIFNHKTAKPEDYTRNDSTFFRRYAMLNSGIESYKGK